MNPSQQLSLKPNHQLTSYAYFMEGYCRTKHLYWSRKFISYLFTLGCQFCEDNKNQA